MTIKEKYQSIDQSKLPSKITEVLTAMEIKSNGFTNEMYNSVFEPQLDKIITLLNNKYPAAIIGNNDNSVGSEESIQIALENLKEILKTFPSINTINITNNIKMEAPVFNFNSSDIDGMNSRMQDLTFKLKTNRTPEMVDSNYLEKGGEIIISEIPENLRTHPQFTIEDYTYFKTKGYTPVEIKEFWDRDLREGKTPVTVNKYKVDWTKESEAARWSPDRLYGALYNLKRLNKISQKEWEGMKSDLDERKYDKIQSMILSISDESFARGGHLTDGFPIKDLKIYEDEVTDLNVRGKYKGYKDGLILIETDDGEIKRINPNLVYKIVKIKDNFKTGGQLSKGDMVRYTMRKGGDNLIPFYGEIISIDNDGAYASVRNQIGNIDYIETSRIKEYVKGGETKKIKPVTGNKYIDTWLALFPDNAKSWANATDEIRETALIVRTNYNELTLDVIEGDEGYVEGLNFRAFKTPSEWNKKAKQQIGKLWKKSNDWTKENILNQLEDYFSIKSDHERYLKMVKGYYEDGGDIQDLAIANSDLFKKGGETKTKWAQIAEKEMEEDGTVGAFTAKAKKANKTTVEYAKEVLKNPNKYNLKTRRQAQFMKNLNPELFESGGNIPAIYSSEIDKYYQKAPLQERGHYLFAHAFSKWNKNDAREWVKLKERIDNNYQTGGDLQDLAIANSDLFEKGGKLKDKNIPENLIKKLKSIGIEKSKIDGFFENKSFIIPVKTAKDAEELFNLLNTKQDLQPWQINEYIIDYIIEKMPSTDGYFDYKTIGKNGDFIIKTHFRTKKPSETLYDLIKSKGYMAIISKSKTTKSIYVEAFKSTSHFTNDRHHLKIRLSNHSLVLDNYVINDDYKQLLDRQFIEEDSITYKEQFNYFLTIFDWYLEPNELKLQKGGELQIPKYRETDSPEKPKKQPPKTANKPKRKTFMNIVAERRKKGEPWKVAQQRVKKELAAEKK